MGPGDDAVERAASAVDASTISAGDVRGFGIYAGPPSFSIR